MLQVSAICYVYLNAYTLVQSRVNYFDLIYRFFKSIFEDGYCVPCVSWNLSRIQEIMVSLAKQGIDK